MKHINKIKCKSFVEIHEALKAGVRVYWGNETYEVKREPYREPLRNDSLFEGHVLDVRCSTNYFGGLLAKSEIKSCYSKGGSK